MLNVDRKFLYEQYETASLRADVTESYLHKMKFWLKVSVAANIASGISLWSLI